MAKNRTNVLVIGAPRSGTTLLAGLLSAGKHASPMLPECTYITQIIRHYYNFLNYSDRQRFAAYAIDEKTLAKMYRSMVDTMLVTVESHFKKLDYRYLILKDPELTLLVEQIPIFFGEYCKIVCVVRDPRAVIASMQEVNRKKSKMLWSELRACRSLYALKNFARHKFLERELLTNTFTYYSAVHESDLYKNGDLHIVSYEKIVSRNEDEFKNLENYLGFSVGRDGFGEAFFDFDRTDPTFSSGYGKTIQPASTNFVKKLSRRKRVKIQAVFSGLNTIYKWWGNDRVY